MANFLGGGTASKGVNMLVSSFSKLKTGDTQDATLESTTPSTSGSTASASLPDGVRLTPGATVPCASLEVPVNELQHSWGSSPGCEFNVRVGPNYKKNGKKDASGPAFYDLVAIDFIKTQNVVDHIASFMALDKIKSDAPEVSGDVPAVFVVNCQLPEGEPAMFNSPDDGPGRSAVFIFTLKPEIAEALKDMTTASPAVKLLAQYFRQGPSDADFRGRFKVIATVKNMEQLDLPGFISNYNSKPVLITKSGSLCKGDGYCEMDIRVHRFSYLAKKGLNYLQGKFAQMVFDVGFVVEARDDEEMPEQMLGTARLFRLDYDKAAKVFV